MSAGAQTAAFVSASINSLARALESSQRVGNAAETSMYIGGGALLIIIILVVLYLR